MRSDWIHICFSHLQVALSLMRGNALLAKGVKLHQHLHVRTSLFRLSCWFVPPKAYPVCEVNCQKGVKWTSQRPSTCNRHFEIIAEHHCAFQRRPRQMPVFLHVCSVVRLSKVGSVYFRRHQFQVNIVLKYVWFFKLFFWRARMDCGQVCLSRGAAWGGHAA